MEEAHWVTGDWKPGVDGYVNFGSEGKDDAEVSEL